MNPYSQQLIVHAQKQTKQAAVDTNALCVLLEEWEDIAKREDDLAERSKYNPNGALARARARTIRTCAQELRALVSEKIQP